MFTKKIFFSAESVDGAQKQSVRFRADVYWVDNELAFEDGGNDYLFVRDQQQATSLSVYVNQELVGEYELTWDNNQLVNVRIIFDGEWADFDGDGTGEVFDTQYGWSDPCECPPEPELCIPCSGRRSPNPAPALSDKKPDSFGAMSARAGLSSFDSCQAEAQALQNQANQTAGVGLGAIATGGVSNPIGIGVSIWFTVETGFLVGRLFGWAQCKLV